jgi:hypothetical protein
MTETEDVEIITVKSHSSVSKMVTKCLTILNRKLDDSSTKINMVEIIADAKVAGKAITIAEIVKRRITEHGGIIHHTTRVQEKPSPAEVPPDNVERKHLQGEESGCTDCYAAGKADFCKRVRWRWFGCWQA